MGRKDYNDTIVAIATPLGEGGVGIVRLSGPRAISIAAKIFHPLPPRNIKTVPSHTLHYGRVVTRKKIVDEGLLAVMRAPHSYTREDVVEIQAHGGAIPLQKILELTLDKGARLAEPGEFTRRAFLNGRLDLTQAEAVLDLVRAKTEAAYDIALRQLSGLLSDKVEDLRQRLLKLLTQVEASIDFPTESGVVLGKSFKRALRIIQGEVEELLKNAQAGRFIREGIRAVIIGRPNVGKSSLMNALLKEKRVIVTHLPGTTRDVVEELVNIQGLPLKIADTSGLRKTRSLIEIQSQTQSQSYIEKADLIILVLDGSQDLKKEDGEIFKKVLETRRPVLIAINKIDLPQRLSDEEIKRFFPGRNIAKISAKYLLGLSTFQRKLVSVLKVEPWAGRSSRQNQTNGREHLLVSRLRHQLSLKKAEESLIKAKEALEKGWSSEFLAFDLWQAVESLGEILGLNYREDLLDEIFQEFCIGK